MTTFRRFAKLIFSDTARDSYWVIGGNVFAAFLAFLYTIFLARVLTPSDLGIFSAVLGFTLLISDVSDVGIGSSLSRFLPDFISRGKRAEADRFTKTSFSLQMYILIVAFTISLVFAKVLSRLILTQEQLWPLFVMASIGIAGTILLAYLSGVMAAQKMFRASTIINTGTTLAKLILVGIFFYAGSLNLLIAVSIFVAAPVIGMLFGIKLLPLSFLSAKFDAKMLKQLLTFASYLGLARVFSAVAGRLDALMLIPLSNSYEAGIYSAAFKIVSIYILIAGSFSQVIAPRLASFPDTAEAVKYLKKIIIVVLLMFVTMFFAYLVAPWFVVFVLGTEYLDSVAVFQASLIPTALFVATIPTVNYIIYVLKKPIVSSINTFVQLLIIIIGNSIFIPLYGRFGPVYTLTLAYGATVLIATFSAIYLHKKQKKVELVGSPVRI